MRYIRKNDIQTPIAVTFYSDVNYNGNVVGSLYEGNYTNITFKECGSIKVTLGATVNLVNQNINLTFKSNQPYLNFDQTKLKFTRIEVNYIYPLDVPGQQTIETWAPKLFKIYSDISFQGRSAQLQVGDYTLAQIDWLLGGTSIKSLKKVLTNGDVYIEVFDEDNFTGNCLVLYYYDEDNLTTWHKFKGVKSLRITQLKEGIKEFPYVWGYISTPSIVIFQKKNFLGQPYYLNLGSYEGGAVSEGRYEVFKSIGSFLIIVPSIQVHFENTEGKTIKFFKSESDLSQFGDCKTINILKRVVIPEPVYKPIYAFEDKNFEGKGRFLEVGEYKSERLNLLGFKFIKSFTMPGGMDFIFNIFEGDNFTGKESKLYVGDFDCNYWFNQKQFQSLKIIDRNNEKNKYVAHVFSETSFNGNNVGIEFGVYDSKKIENDNINLKSILFTGYQVACFYLYYESDASGTFKVLRDDAIDLLKYNTVKSFRVVPWFPADIVVKGYSDYYFRGNPSYHSIGSYAYGLRSIIIQDPSIYVKIYEFSDFTGKSIKLHYNNLNDYINCGSFEVYEGESLPKTIKVYSGLVNVELQIGDYHMYNLYEKKIIPSEVTYIRVGNAQVGYKLYDGNMFEGEAKKFTTHQNVNGISSIRVIPIDIDVWFFNHPYYRGYWYCFAEGDYDWEFLQNTFGLNPFVDLNSILLMNQYVYIEIFDDVGFTGNMITININEPYVSNFKQYGFEGIVSFKVKRNLMKTKTEVAPFKKNVFKQCIIM